MSTKVLRRCEACAKPFEVSSYKLEQGRGRFCSRLCRRRRVTKACGACGVAFEVKASQEAIGEGRYCSRTCLKADAPRRFWEKVDKHGAVPEHATHLGSCWLWTASTSSRGYGTVGWGGKTVHAHRVSYEIANGAIPTGDGYHGTCVLHRCDNRACVNPAHLFLGTNAENMADMVAKGRAAKHAGNDNGRAKLSEADVLSIRALCASGRTRRSVAAEYGVTPETVSGIALGKTWRHLKAETPSAEAPGVSEVA